MSTYSSDPSEDQCDDDYGEEYGWWDEYEDALDEEIHNGN